MIIIHTDDLKEDMILSEDIKDITGRLLLQKGNIIQSNHINIIKKWGVTEVKIDESPVYHQKDPSHEIIKANKNNEQEVKQIFKHVDLDHPAMKELFRLSVLFRAENSVTEANHNIISFNTEDYEKLSSEDILKDLSLGKIKLAELPSIVFELNEVLSDPLSTADDLAQIVSKSPSLTAVLLKIANSSYYGVTSRIETISRAVTMIGTREISSLALAICTVSVFKGVPENILDMHSFLKHSFTCGLISRIIAASLDIRQTEQLFVSGLLHDIGRVIIYTHYPEQGKSILSHCISTKDLLYKEEIKYLGCTHSDVAGYLLHLWNFPSIITNSVSNHHNPRRAHNQIFATIVHLSDIIVNALGIGSSGERYVPPLHYESWEKLDLSPSSFEVIIRQAVHQLSVLEPFLKD